MTFALGGCQLILAIVLLLASIAKIVAPESLTRALQISGFPLLLTKMLPVIVVTMELSLAVSLLFSTSEILFLSMLGTFVLLSAFTGWLIFVYIRKTQVTCGCFGAINASVTKGSLFRNALLMGLALLGMFFAQKVPSIFPAPATWNMVPSIVLSGGGILLLLGRQYAFGAMFFGPWVRPNGLN